MVVCVRPAWPRDCLSAARSWKLSVGCSILEVVCRLLDPGSGPCLEEVLVHLVKELWREVFPVGVREDGVDAAVRAEGCVGSVARLGCGLVYL